MSLVHLVVAAAGQITKIEERMKLVVEKVSLVMSLASFKVACSTFEVSRPSCLKFVDVFSLKMTVL